MIKSIILQQIIINFQILIIYKINIQIFFNMKNIRRILNWYKMILRKLIINIRSYNKTFKY